MGRLAKRKSLLSRSEMERRQAGVLASGNVKYL